MNDRKILFFDIDGTLVTDDEKKIFPEDTKEALRLAKEKGHLLFINTGRVKSNVEKYFFDAGIEGLVCGCGTYISYNDEVLFRNIVPKAVCRNIAQIARKCLCFPLYEDTDFTCYDKERICELQVKLIKYFEKMDRKLIDNIDDPKFAFDKFCAWYDENSDMEQFKREISPWFDYIQREGDFCELIPKGFSKATGIRFVLDYFNIPIHNAYVFGDSNNDLQMLEYVENSIVLGGGSKAAKEAASYVTSDILDGGLYKAMKHFDII